MISRYNPTFILDPGKRAECSVRGMPSLQQIEVIQNNCFEVVFKEGDRIDLIAADHYGDSRLWWLVADLNADRFSDPLDIPLGTRIRILN